MGLLMRREDWPERLAEVVSAAESRPYRLGEWDCVRFACACIEAMTGHDYWPTFAGGYTTRREALRFIAARGQSLAEATTAVLGIDPQPVAMGRRGDVVIYRDAVDEHIGICLGSTVAVLAEGGLARIGLLNVGMQASWRVG